MLKTDNQIVACYVQVNAFVEGMPFLQDVPSCVCLRHEDWPGLEKITALCTEGH